MTPAVSVLARPNPATSESPRTVWEPSRPGLARHLDQLREYSMRLRFQRNETIFHAGEPAVHIYRVAAGCIRLCRHVGDGRRNISEFMFPGDIFGLGDYRDFPNSAEAATSATVVGYPAMLFEQLCENNTLLQSDLLAHYSKCLGRAQHHLFVTGCQNARERMASFIVGMAGTDYEVYGSRIDLPMARQDIADYLGLTIETICRSLAALKKAGIIAIPNAHQVDICNAEALQALADGTHTD